MSQHTPGYDYICDDRLKSPDPLCPLHAQAPAMLELLRKSHSIISYLDSVDHPLARDIYDLIIAIDKGAWRP